MKIRLLTAATQWGGLEGHAVALADLLQDQGHDVAIVELGRRGFAWRKDARSIRTNLIFVPLDQTGRLDKPLQEVSALAWRRILRQLNADVGVFIKGGFDVGSWRLDLAARLYFGRYLTIEQLACPMPPAGRGRHAGGLLPGLGLWRQRLLVRRRLRSPWPHTVVCVSEAVRAPLLHDYGFASHKLVTVHNGVDVATFRPDAACRRALRKAWGIPDQALVFGAVGRLDAVKGYDVAIEEFGRLAAAMPARDMRLVLAGDGPERGGLERLVEQRRLGDRIRFAGFTDRPQDVYPALDVFLMPSRNEGLPLALVEAMACGCSPIAMAVGGIPEVLVDPRLGWLVQAGDREGFFDAMRAAARMDGAAVAALGRHAREHAVARFDARVQLAAVADLITNSAASRPERRNPRSLPAAAAQNT